MTTTNTKRPNVDVITDAWLTWPAGLARTKERRRGLLRATFQAARDAVVRELALLGVREVQISGELQVRADGLPSADQQRSRDPAIAVYFVRRASRFVVAIDVYSTHAANMQAIAHVLRAVRALERHGQARLLEQALEGFRALVPGKVLALPQSTAGIAWWRVLGFAEAPASLREAQRAYHEAVRNYHPDQLVGLSPDVRASVEATFRAASRAMGEAREHFGRAAT